MREEAAGGIVGMLSSARARKENTVDIVSRDGGAYECRI